MTCAYCFVFIEKRESRFFFNLGQEGIGEKALEQDIEALLVSHYLFNCSS